LMRRSGSCPCERVVQCGAHTTIAEALASCGSCLSRRQQQDGRGRDTTTTTTTAGRPDLVDTWCCVLGPGQYDEDLTVPAGLQLEIRGAPANSGAVRLLGSVMVIGAGTAIALRHLELRSCDCPAVVVQDGGSLRMDDVCVKRLGQEAYGSGTVVVEGRSSQAELSNCVLSSAGTSGVLCKGGSRLELSCCQVDFELHLCASIFIKIA
jgi:hypothetical protein